MKRFQVRNIVDASSQRDIRDASVYERPFCNAGLTRRVHPPQAVHQAAVLRVVRCARPYCPWS